MALQKEFTTEYGFLAPAAYVRIITFNGDKTVIMVNIEVHKDSEARFNGLKPIATFSTGLSLTYGATIQQMYDALKLLPEFSGAVDV